MSENLPRLYYSAGNKLRLLPEWAYFFIRVGYHLAIVPFNRDRIVIGLAIPTRSFACGLVGVGINLARPRKPKHGLLSQIQYIRGLEPGTSVYIRTDDARKHPGIVQGHKEYNGQKIIVIKTGKQEERGFPIDDYALRITVADHEVSLPKYQQKGYKAENPTKFLRCCLGSDLANDHISGNSFEALFVSKKSVFEYESCALPFYCKADSESAAAEGFLQEILRVRQFSGENKTYRTQCIASSNITPEKDIGSQTPPIVVFDGAIAYIKLGHKWRSAHQIVLLDRTERQFVDASELLNQNYAYRLAGSFKFSVRIPDGIEMMVYRDSVQ